jgi:hypothetical protein
MVLAKNKKKIIKTIDAEFSDNDFQDINKGCENIRTVKTKENEDRADYISEFKQFFPIYEKLVSIVEKSVDELRDSTEDSKSDLRYFFINEIRSNQERLGITSKLLNIVKYSMIKTIVSWKNNPKKLEKKSVYIPRKKKDDTKGLTVLRSFETTPDIDFEILSKKENENNLIIKMNLINNRRFPLQNIYLKILDEENNEIKIIKVSGDFTKLDKKNNEVKVQFLKAPMNDNETSMIVITTSQLIDELLKMSVHVDATFHQKQISFQKSVI